MSKKSIALATYKDLPLLDPDDQLLQQSLAARGYQVLPAIWNDGDFDWSKHQACVLRSTWDYHLAYEDFVKWIDAVSKSSRLFNPAQMVKWNSRKTYLRELEDAGLPVIPTVFIGQNESVPSDGSALLNAMLERNWSEAVIKPSIGLASSGVRKIKQIDAPAAQGHLDQLLKRSEVMIQEFMPSVADYGERALIFIDGKYSHCVRKSAFQKLAAAGHAGESAAVDDPVEIKLGQEVLSFLKETPLYARVDLVRDSEFKPRLIEFELVEPSLFISFCPASADLFADAIIRRL